MRNLSQGIPTIMYICIDFIVCIVSLFKVKNCHMQYVVWEDQTAKCDNICVVCSIVIVIKICQLIS